MQVPKRIVVVIGAFLVSAFHSGTPLSRPPAETPSPHVRFAHEPVRHPLTLRAVVHGEVRPGATVEVDLEVASRRGAESVTLSVDPGAVALRGPRVRRVDRLSAGTVHGERLRLELPESGVRHLLEIRARAVVDDAVVERAVHVNFVLQPEPRRKGYDRHGRPVWETPAERLR